MNSNNQSNSRRSFVSGLAATAVLPVWAQSISSNPDVVVIGAGSAGLSAARTLIAAGRSVVVVEAAGRIGGRAFTESNTFGVPFDHGCSWIQGGANLPMGLLSKIALQFDGEKFGLYRNQWLSYRVPNEMPAEACFFLTWPFDFNLMIGFIGGQFGWQLTAKGLDVAVDFALGEVVRMLGSDARKHFVKGYLTQWSHNPWTQGAYAAARPGHYGARGELAKPLGERVFFAGEAVAAPYYQLCAGAYASGEKAAREVVAAIG